MLVARLIVAAWLLVGCGGSDPTAPADPDRIEATLGAGGGELVGDQGIFDGLVLVAPAGALTGDVKLVVTEAVDTNPLPEGGVSLGPQFRLGPADTPLAKALTVTVPYSPARLDEEDGDPLAVKVWYVGPDGWALLEPTARSDTSVTVALDLPTAFGAGLFSP